MDDYKDVDYVNKIGDINNSTIANIVQTIQKSVEIPDDLKDLLITCLLLFKEDYEWQKEQRLKAQREIWLAEKNTFYRKSARNWQGGFYIGSLLLSAAAVSYFYLYPRFLQFIQYNHSVSVFDIGQLLNDAIPQKALTVAFGYALLLLPVSWFVGSWIGNLRANRKYGKFFQA